MNTGPTGGKSLRIAHPLDLFGEERLPQGLKYQADFLSQEEERALIRNIEVLPFKEFEFHGFTGKRRTVSFGWRYDFNGGGLAKAEDMPEFLTGLRACAEIFAESAPGSFQQVLVTEYSPGAGIGWHKDRAVFGDVVGISLLSPCTFRLRKRTRLGFKRQTLIAAPRSVYLLRDASRTEWEHSIPAVESLRYSVTFRMAGRTAGLLFLLMGLQRPSQPSGSSTPTFVGVRGSTAVATCRAASQASSTPTLSDDLLLIRCTSRDP